MPKTKHKPFEGIDSRYRGAVASSSWSLCIGAGVSFGLVPTWHELTRRIVNQAFNVSYDKTDFTDLVENIRWSLDALLQGAANQLTLEGKPSEYCTGQPISDTFI